MNHTPDPSHLPDDDSVYAGLLGSDDSQWAFGTDFEDPLAGVDTTVPDGVDTHELAVYCLMLADDALVMSHRLSQWCSNAPDLEEDIALANIALDLLGQARLLLARAAATSSARCVVNSSAYSGQVASSPATSRRRDSSVPRARVRNQRPA